MKEFDRGHFVNQLSQTANIGVACWRAWEAEAAALATFDRSIAKRRRRSRFLGFDRSRPTLSVESELWNTRKRPEDLVGTLWMVNVDCRSCHAVKPKILTTIVGYTPRQFGADALAGVTVALVALPLSIAIAIASGAPPQLVWSLRLSRAS